MPSCQHTAGPDTLPASAPISVGEHTAEVHHHDNEAAHYAFDLRQKRESRGVGGCITMIPVADPSSSKGQGGFYGPCWTLGVSSRQLLDEEIQKNREYAKQHRARAEQLLEAEQKACSRLRKEDILLSPSYRRKDIKSVIDYKEKGHARGAVVLFRPVDGLSAAWMYEALTCHQARAAVMGYDENFQSYCPASIRGTSFSVIENEQGILVTYRSESEEATAITRKRAYSLIGVEK